MEAVFRLLISNGAICCYEGMVLGVIFAYYLKLRKKKKQCVQMSALRKEKAREEKLDQALKNDLYQGDKNKLHQKNIPYEVNFHEEVTAQNLIAGTIAVQIVEQSKLSTRKYMIHISEEIGIGRSRENALVLNDLAIAEKQCRLFKYEDGLYLQTLEDTHPVIVRRKRNTIKLSKDAVRLLDGDMIELGETRLTMYII